MFPARWPELRASMVALRSGLTVRVVECGDKSAPAIVFIPGWGCSAYIFRHNLAPMARAGFRAAAIELKGHGLSDKPMDASEYTVGALTVHILEILDALGIHHAGLTGLSMGGALATHVAACAPDRISACAVVSPVGFGGLPLLSLMKLLTPPFANRVLPHLARRRVISAILFLVYGRLYRPTARDVDEYWAPTQFPENAVALRHLLHRFPWTAECPRLAIPWLEIGGTGDPLRKNACLPRGLQLPRLERRTVADAGHVVYDEAPDVVNAALVEFFRSAMGARPVVQRTA